MKEELPNYTVTIKSRLGSHSQILDEEHLESCESFDGILDAIDYISRRAVASGWRNFTLETVNPRLAKPLRGKPAGTQALPGSDAL